MECGTIIMGPNDARRVVWGVFLLYFLYLTNVLFHTATTGRVSTMTAGVWETVLALYVKDLHPRI